MPEFQSIHFVINPAAGQPEPILHMINKILYPYDMEWEVSVTRADGDGQRMAQNAVANGADLIVAYGGDGTVKDVANGLLDCDIPLGILHGGTGNAMAYELGIPASLEEALELIVGEHELRGIDVGQVTCHDAPDKKAHFLLRMSTGLQTKILETASRDLKTRFGNLAYVMASLQELRESENTTYHLTIDGEDVTGDGLTTLIANSAFIGGQVNFSFAPLVNPADGQLDILVMNDNFVDTMQMIGSALKIEGVEFQQHWQGKDITIHEPAGELITLDGEMFGKTPATIKILENAVMVVVPIHEE